MSKLLALIFSAMLLAALPGTSLAVGGPISTAITLDKVTAYQWTYFNTQTCDQNRTVYQIYRTDFRWYRSTTSRTVQAKTRVGYEGIDCGRMYQKSPTTGWTSWTSPCWACGNSTSTLWTRTYTYSTSTWKYVSQVPGMSTWGGSWAWTKEYSGATLVRDHCQVHPVFGAGDCDPY